ncbi:hypothetical protein D3C72_1760960 [compost metagenome]
MIYWRFTIEKLSIEEISKRHAISESDLKKSLQKLVSLDLVAQRRGKFQPKHQGKFRWPDDSRLAKLLNHEWSQLTLKKALRAQDNKTHRLMAIKLSDESYEALLLDLSRVFDAAVQTSERESLMSSHQIVHDVTALFAAVNEGVFEV